MTDTLIGRRFGRLIVVESSSTLASGKRRTVYKCQCDCGQEKVVWKHNLLKGASKSCGCLSRQLARDRNATHGFTRGYSARSEYTTWQSMIGRCHKPKWVNYADYGGRGVTVCDRWRYGENGWSPFECFLHDMGGKPTPALTIERIDGTKPYEPTNCRWATRTEQARNRKSNHFVTYKGQRMHLKDALAASGISESGFYARVKRGWSEDRALETAGRPKREIASMSGS